jgi:hypothetical protein
LEKFGASATSAYQQISFERRYHKLVGDDAGNASRRQINNIKRYLSSMMLNA